MVVERIIMNQFSLEEDSEISVTKTHAEIIEMIEEIKKYENKFQKFDLEIIESDKELIDLEPEILEFTEVENDIVHFIEVDKDKLEQFGLVQPDQRKQKKKVKKRIKFRFLNPKKKDENKIGEVRVINPTIFKLRINEEGKLINTELKAPKVPSNSKKGKFLKKISIKKGKKSKTETSEEKQKTSKIKEGLRKLGRLKKAIPTKSKKENKSEKIEESG